MTERTNWDAFFDPQLVCVVGASADPARIGGRLVRYSIESGFGGRIVPVNPHRDSIFGLPAVPSLAKLDEPPDWVVVAVPGEGVPEVVAQAGELGASNVLVVAAGFAEVGEVGRQHELVTIARRYGMRLLGPNSNGFMNVATGAFFAFTPVIDSARPVPGELAIVTQSAALGTYLLNHCRTTGMGVRHWVHTGNEADTTLLEVTRALAGRGQVRAIALCVEVLRDLETLRATLQALAAAGIAVGVLQAGTSPAGKRASQAHTAALIGAESELLADLFTDAGAYAAGSIGKLADFLQAAVRYPDLPAQPRIGLVTTSGGVGVLAADALAADRLPMPTLSPALQRQIRSYAPFSHPANPVDTTAQVINQPDAMPRIIGDCLNSGELDLLGVFVAHGLAGLHDRTLRQLIDLGQQRGGEAGTAGPALVAVGLLSPDAAHAVQRCGIAVFPEPAALSAALRAYLDSSGRRAVFLARQRPVAGESAPGGPVPGEPVPGGPVPVPAGALPAIGPGPGGLDEWSAKALLRGLGATVVPGRLVNTPAEAVAAAEQLGYPVVLKLSSQRLPHKAARGGVRLDLWTRAAVRAAFGALTELADELAREQAAGPAAELAGEATGGPAAELTGEPARLLVERQAAGPELFVGAVRHDRLGVLVGIGPGGSGVEQARAVRWRWAPIAPEDVRAASGVGALVDVMVRLVADPALGVHTVETNPVILTGDGQALVADALIERSTPEDAAPYWPVVAQGATADADARSQRAGGAGAATPTARLSTGEGDR
jgi:acyl-CoA synthetase (NDP forming)